MRTIILSNSGTEEGTGAQEPRGLWDLMGRPMLSYALDLSQAVSDQDPTVISRVDSSCFREAFSDRRVEWRSVSGTGFLAECAGLLQEDGVDPDEPILLLRADTPLIRARDLQGLLACHEDNEASLTLLSGTEEEGFPCTLKGERSKTGAVDTEGENETGSSSAVTHATDVAVIRADALLPFAAGDKRGNGEASSRLGRELIRRLIDEGHPVKVYSENDPSDTVRVQSAKSLGKATERLRKRVISMLQEQGVKVLSPAQTYIEPDVSIGEGTVIEPFVVVRNGVEVGTNCHLGPFCQIREGTILEDRAEIGNYVETKNSRVGRDTKAKHLSYLGDATIGDDVNIGAGTITANYDGVHKHRTTIEDHASTGSNTVLIAPVTMKEGSKTGAGAVVARGEDVEKGDTVVGVPARRLDQ